MHLPVLIGCQQVEKHVPYQAFSVHWTELCQWGTSNSSGAVGRQLARLVGLGSKQGSREGGGDARRWLGLRLGARGNVGASAGAAAAVSAPTFADGPYFKCRSKRKGNSRWPRPTDR